MLYLCVEAGCGATFDRPSKLKFHELKHAGKKLFKCGNCHKEYFQRQHLVRHQLRVHHGVKDVKIQCPIEGCTSVVSSGNLNRHKRLSHNPDRKYPCKICGEQFNSSNCLKSHMPVHRPMNTYTCELCNKEFNKLWLYTRHTKNHKKFSCTCGEVFYKFSLYVTHKKTAAIHFQPKKVEKFTCDICKKTIMHKRPFEDHLQTHAEKRCVFKCPMQDCDRFYYYRRNLMFHIETIHYKTKSYPKRKRQNKKKSENEERKQTFRKSTALKLSNLKVSKEIEKRILNGEQIDIQELRDDDSDQDSNCENDLNEGRSEHEDTSSSDDINKSEDKAEKLNNDTEETQ